MAAANRTTAASRVKRTATGGFTVGSRTFASEREFQTARPTLYAAYQQSQGNSGTAYRNQEDVPRLIERFSNGRKTDPSVLYQGQYYDRATFARLFPGPNADFERAGGGSGPAAGQSGSPYPATLPANSFEAALNDLNKAIDDANRANQERYQRQFRINERRLDELNQTFTGVRASIDADNTLSGADQAALVDAADRRGSELRAGYDQAKTELDQVGQQALRDADRAAMSGQARTTQDAITGGIFSSTILNANRRRDAESSARTKQGIFESIAAQRAGLSERRAGALAGAAGDKINVQSGQAQAAQAGRLRRTDVETTFRAARDQVLSDRAGFIERASDEGPNQADVANLILQREQAKAASKGKSAGSQIFSSLLGGVAGGVSGGVSTGIGSILGGLFSDRRLKRNIVNVGERRGLPYYTFEYTSAAIEEGLGQPGRFEGYMADEVMAEHPQAVGKHASGYLTILDARFQAAPISPEADKAGG